MAANTFQENDECSVSEERMHFKWTASAVLRGDMCISRRRQTHLKRMPHASKRWLLRFTGIPKRWEIDSQSTTEALQTEGSRISLGRQVYFERTARAFREDDHCASTG